MMHPRNLRPRIVGVVAAMLAPWAAGAQTPVTVVTADLERQKGMLLSITAEGLELRSDAGVTKLPLGDVLLLERAEEPATAAGGDPYLLRLRDGQRLYGAPAGMAGDMIEWKSSTLGLRRVELKDVEQIVARAEAARTVVSTPTQDELHLANGDVVTGVLAAGDDAAITCRMPDGQDVLVEWTNIKSIRLAPAGAPGRPAGVFRLLLRDGNRFLCDQVELRGNSLFVGFGETRRPVDVSQLVVIEHLAASTRLLADLPPVRVSYEPYFPRLAARPVGADGPDVIQVGEIRTRSFVSMRPRGEMTWAVDGARRFRTRYAIPAGLPSADAAVRIRVDGNVVHERTGLRSGQVSDLIDVDVTGAKALTLEVDFGDGFDVQDRVLWIEPALSL